MDPTAVGVQIITPEFIFDRDITTTILASWIGMRHLRIPQYSITLFTYTAQSSRMHVIEVRRISKSKQ